MSTNSYKIFETNFGSQIYGTATPESDQDVKGIFIASFEDIILKKDKESIVNSTGNQNSKNNSEDVDTEYKELRRFIKDLLNGQTYAIDMIFTPNQHWLKTTPIWDFIIQNRHKALSKNVKPFIGYCNQQAGKYGLKGSRLGVLNELIEILETANPKDRLSNILLPTNEFISYASREQKCHDKNGEIKTIEYKLVNILGKFYPLELHVKDVLKSLNIFKNKFGDRAKLALDNKGVDWKAISHAYRACFELEELARTGEISFPLTMAEFLLDVKLGKLNYNFISEDLPIKMNWAIKALDDSSLPQMPNFEFWEKFILSTYANHVQNIQR